MSELAEYVIVTKHDPTKRDYVQWEAELYEVGADTEGPYLHYESEATEEKVVALMRDYILTLQVTPADGHKFYTDALGNIIAMPMEVK